LKRNTKKVRQKGYKEKHFIISNSGKRIAVKNKNNLICQKSNKKRAKTSEA
jgi:hypothetical protein